MMRGDNVLNNNKKMVLPERIELSTSPLPMECSTTELRQHGGERIADQNPDVEPFRMLS